MGEYTPENQVMKFGLLRFRKNDPPSQTKIDCVAKKTTRNKFLSPAAKNIERSKSRVAPCATSLAATVAQNDYFGRNIAPAQQGNSYDMNALLSMHVPSS